MMPFRFRKRSCFLRIERPLRGLIGTLLFTSWLGVYAQPLTGTHNITGTSAFNSTGGQFATIQEAFDSLMTRGVGPGGVTFRVQDSWITAPTGLAAELNTDTLSTYPGSAPDNPVLLTFADLTDKVYYVKSPSATAGRRFLFRFTGNIKYFTIDGANKLILKSNAAGNDSTGLIGFVSTSSLDLEIDAITIRNIIMHGNGRANTFVGVYIGDDETLGRSVSAGSSIGAAGDITIEQCIIDSVSRPIHVAGIRTNTQNIRILADTIGKAGDPSAWLNHNGMGAIHLRGVLNATIQGCVIHGAASATNYQASGIRLDTCENFTVERNWIYNIRYTGSGASRGSYGIYIQMPESFIGSPANVVVNNMIAGISSGGGNPANGGVDWVSGIFVTGPTTGVNLNDSKLSIIHNSINLYGAYGGGGNPLFDNGTSSGITLGPEISGGVTIDGNLIQNTFKAVNNDTAQAIAILTTSPSAAGFNINYNQYYIGGSAVTVRFGRFGDTGVATFSEWQAIAALGNPDANGMMHGPGRVPFLSDTNLHLDASSQSSAINAGNVAYNGSQDFDNQTRPIGGSSDPGTAPDVGADELDGSSFPCPSNLRAPEIIVTSTYPPLANTAYIWGQRVQFDTTGTNSPPFSGTLRLIYSLDGGTTWTSLRPVTDFPVTITLPPLIPPTYTGTLLAAVVAEAPSSCGLTPDTSNNPVSINLSDRLGNRPPTAIPVTLTSSGSGTWRVVLQDSTNGIGTSNEYRTATQARWGSDSKDLFFRLTLPDCLDSLMLNTCSQGTQYNTRIHFINATTNDTITNDDQGPSCSTAGQGLTPGNTSQIIVYGLPNALGATQTIQDDIGYGSSPKIVRDTALLVRGHTFYVVVEGSDETDEGKFEITISGYKLPRPRSISVSGAPTAPVCINSAPITLNASGGAPYYLWRVDGSTVPGQNGATFILPTTAEGTFSIQAVAIYNPNQDPACATAADSVASSRVTITVEDTVRAKIADANDNIVSGQTLEFTARSNITLKASSPQASGNTYTWRRYNSIPPAGSPVATSTGSALRISFAGAGNYTIIMEAVRGTGSCGSIQDTVYLNVVSGFGADIDGFSISPNPSTGTFMVSVPVVGRYRVEVLDVVGRLVATEAFEGTTHQMRLTLPAGVYQIRLIEGEKVSAQRLIITE